MSEIVEFGIKHRYFQFFLVPRKAIRCTLYGVELNSGTVIFWLTPLQPRYLYYSPLSPDEYLPPIDMEAIFAVIDQKMFGDKCKNPVFRGKNRQSKLSLPLESNMFLPRVA